MSYSLVVFEATRYKAGDTISDWTLEDSFWSYPHEKPEVSEVEPERVLQLSGEYRDYPRYKLLQDATAIDINLVGEKSSIAWLVSNAGVDFVFQDVPGMWEAITDLIADVFNDVDAKVKETVHSISVLTLWHYHMERTFNGEYDDYEDYWQLVGVVTDEMLERLAKGIENEL